ncbi:cell envelope integrity protein CreD [Mucilaginibacter rubeus]|uniref:Cell envelope integrity protein CreD n=1 Tax=Mucilaginibacter rubeus TaxID=2027860 RepID=A0A5C1HS10_9SPHI|nr:cell envelope integrity protein CreD [Mucilaginibacter rubeus]QEM08672.1 cell envelope integrity protein CreD [Mucilaginibacter rubeus]
MIGEQFPKQTTTDWLKESATFKLIFIGVLALLLLIPSAFIQNLVTERASRQDEMAKEVSDSWSASQIIKGPVLVIPYRKGINITDTTKQTPVENLYILPDNLHIKASLATQILHRGIFDVAVYNTQVKVSGNFARLNLSSLGINTNQLILNKARFEFSVSDLKGLKSNPVIKTNQPILSAEPSFESVFGNGLQAPVDLSAVNDNEIPFDYTLDLKGSEGLSFLQLGKTTDVQVNSNWSSPSFDGNHLPDERKIDTGGFSAGWRMMYYNRPFPQQWTGSQKILDNDKKLANATFGVKLRLPVDQYQKTMRTSKYAIFIILLTFISLFLTEIIRKQPIHMFNYILIGAAMVIYYTLLLSFSEQVGYNMAYLIASVSTIMLISVFISSLLKNSRAALLFAFILAVFYAFIFVIIQLEDLALMVGSIALFIIIAVLMYFSRKINWDKN